MKRLFVPFLVMLVGLASAGIFSLALALTLTGEGAGRVEESTAYKFKSEWRTEELSPEETERRRAAHNLRERGTQIRPYPALPLSAAPISIETGMAGYSQEESFYRKQIAATLANRDPLAEERKSEFKWIQDAGFEPVSITGWTGNVEEVEISQNGYEAIIKIKPRIASRATLFYFTHDYCLETWSYDGENLSFVSRDFPQDRKKTLIIMD